MLVVNDIYRFYHVGNDETAALRGASLSVAAGEIIAIVGPSGSGKSTLLSCITGLDDPDGGWVEVDGTRMTRRSEAERSRLRARYFGILLQSGNLFGHLTAEENVRLQTRLSDRVDEARIASLLGSVGLAQRKRAYPTQLSGGGLARAGLAVALAADPPILVADEPTAEVDRQTESLLIDVFKARREHGLSTIIATHSLEVAVMADRIVRLKDGRVADE